MRLGKIVTHRVVACFCRLIEEILGDICCICSKIHRGEDKGSALRDSVDESHQSRPLRKHAASIINVLRVDLNNNPRDTRRADEKIALGRITSTLWHVILPGAIHCERKRPRIATTQVRSQTAGSNTK